MSQKNHSFKSSLVSTTQLTSTIAKKFQAAPTVSTMSFFKEKRANMQRILTAASFATLLLVGCQKEELTNPTLNTTASDNLSASASGSNAPVVDAGDEKIVVDSSFSNSYYSSTKLHGSVSGSSVTVEWKQISGVSTATIEKPTSTTTKVSDLKPGVYSFLLTATDSKGVSSSDTAFVSVLKKMTWTIEGVTREALVHPSSNSSVKAPVIFAFHGHGQTDDHFAEYAFELQWPEAVVVYPQGLLTASHNDPSGSRTGWQHKLGEVNSKTGIADQDLKFYDAMRHTMINKFHAAKKKMFAHGWSNGGEFVYNVLWNVRGDQLAALAPAAATSGKTEGKRTMPVIHIAGTSDPVVPFSKQQESTQSVRTLDECAATGTTWATGPKGLLGKRYASAISDHVVFMQYDGGHAYPATIPPHIVNFFKQVLAGM